MRLNNQKNDYNDDTSNSFKDYNGKELRWHLNKHSKI